MNHSFFWIQSLLVIMLQLSYKRNNFSFQYPFSLAKGTKIHQDTLQVSLKLAALKGWGEASAISYHNVSVDSMTQVLDARRMMIERYTFIDPERFWHFLHHLIPGEHFLTAALDIAGWDLFGKMRRQPVYKLLGLNWAHCASTDYTLGIANPEQIKERIAQHPHPIYKMKVGSAQDLEALKAARQTTNATIRIDANEAWTIEDARQLLPQLEALQIELIEQPLNRNDIDGMRELKKLTNIPIIADEACQNEKDLAQIEGLYDGINVKLAKCSGITPAFALIKTARERGLKIMLGCMSEGVVGCTAMSHLLPLADYADIDGPLILQDDTFTGMKIENGIIAEPIGFGLGLIANEK